MFGRVGDAPTIPAPGSGPGAVLVVSDDAKLVQRLRRSLREPAWNVQVARGLPPADGLLEAHVLVLDPHRARPEATVALDMLGRVLLRPSVVLVLRITEDLATAVTFGLGCVEASAVGDVLADAVDRAYRFRRRPRVQSERG